MNSANIAATCGQHNTSSNYSQTNINELLEFDRKHVWHPYTSATKALKCYPVAKAEGVYIELMDGKRLIDGMSSWWSPFTATTTR